MDRKYVRYNSCISLILQVIEVASGLVLPRLILLYYGSTVNGLVSSVTQFLNVISFLDMGTSAVVISSLYKPLVEHDQNKVDQIVSAAEKFFRKIAYILIGYVALLCVIYPFISDYAFSNLYSASLTVAIAIGLFSQYYIGIVDKIFLTANQKLYIYNITYIIALILNTVISIGLIRFGVSIQLVKLSASLIYLLRPVFTRLYIRNRYHLNRKASFEKDTIPQRWNGVAQHISFQVLQGTDSMVLTIFSSLSDVSVYAVYHLVLTGVRGLLVSSISGIEPRLGALWAEKKYSQTESEYKYYEWIYHIGVTFAYGCVMSLMVPFVMVYTKGVTDVDYRKPVFSVIITLAYTFMAIAQFGQVLLKAINHYKQTQTFYIITALINIVISVIFVNRYGLIGVAVGTLVAMVFQFGWTQWYLKNHVFRNSYKEICKQIFVDCLIMIIGFLITNNWSISSYTYLQWLLLAIKESAVYVLIIFIFNYMFFHKNMKRLLGTFVKRKETKL